MTHSPPHAYDNNANTLHGSNASPLSPHSPHDTPTAPSNTAENRSFHHMTHHHSPANISPAATVKSEHAAGVNMAF